MRPALLAVVALSLSCATPRAYQWSASPTPETAQCVQACGGLRNQCMEARRWSSLLWFGLVDLGNETLCATQFDHCVSVCPGIGEPPRKVKAPAPEAQPMR